MTEPSTQDVQISTEAQISTGFCDHDTTTHDDHRTFEGASAMTSDDLPMVVWLRGDEPYGEAFTMDAEAAMEALGIKRSRLTQISGKELRVGRKRIDRYVRPVYRQEDIEEYKGWTRAPATHQRSSSALKEAADELREHSQGLTDQFMEAIGSHQRETQEAVSGVVDETYRLQQETQTSLRKTLEIQQNELQAILSQHQAELAQTLHTIHQTMDNFTSNHQKQQTEQEAQQKNFAEVISTQFAQYENALNAVQQRQSDLNEDFRQLVAATRETATVQNRFNRNLAEVLSKSLEAQRAMSLKVDVLVNAKTERSSESTSTRRRSLPRMRRLTAIKRRR